MSSSKFGLIFALVAPQKSGKTRLIKHVLERFAVFKPVVTYTTRAWREPDDGIFYHTSVAHAELEAARIAGRTPEFIVYGEQIYATYQGELDAALVEGHLIGAFTEEGVSQLRQNGYKLVVVYVETIGAVHDRQDSARSASERLRVASSIEIQQTIVNDFTRADGFEKAAQDLETFISSCIQVS